jgi:lipid-A-disaccharide synthase
LLQQECKPEKLAATLQSLLSDPTAAAAQRAGFADALASLHLPDMLPSNAAAASILRHLD